MKFIFLTLFPDIFSSCLNVSVGARAMKEGRWQMQTVNLRDFGFGPHKKVDEKPFGGGPGMLMRADVLGDALEFALRSITGSYKVLITCASAKTYDQQLAEGLVKSYENIIVVCGRFEGIDKRFAEYYSAQEVSIGNFVLFGGEVAALAIAESCIRLIPGVLGNEETLKEESFNSSSSGIFLEYDQYTQPSCWKGLEVPSVLRGGNHKEIEKWRNDNFKAKIDNLAKT